MVQTAEFPSVPCRSDTRNQSPSMMLRVLAAQLVSAPGRNPLDEVGNCPPTGVQERFRCRPELLATGDPYPTGLPAAFSKVCLPTNSPPAFR